MSQSEALTPFPLHFVTFVSRYLSLRAPFTNLLPPHLCADLVGQGYFYPIPHYGRGEDGDVRDSQVPGEPFISAVFYDPGPATQAKPISAGRCCPSSFNSLWARSTVVFRGSIRRPLFRCLRFAAPVTRTPRKTRYRLAATLGRTGLSPAGLQREVSGCQFIPSSSPKLAWRTKKSPGDVSI